MANPIEILLQHDRWATRQMLEACAPLSPEDFSRAFAMGPGSLQATLTHLIAAMNAWADTLAGRAHRPRIDQGGQRFSPAELMKLHEEAAREFAELARSRPLDERVTRVREGKEFVYTRELVLLQVMTHGMHHRAQCLNMLRQIGVKTMPLSSVVEWWREVGAK